MSTGCYDLLPVHFQFLNRDAKGFEDDRSLSAELSVAWGLAWFARNHKALASLWMGREGTPRLL